MACVALTCTIEISFTRACISRNDVSYLVGATVGGKLHLHVEKFRQVSELHFRESGKGRHPARRSAVMHDGPDFFTFVIVQHDTRPKQIGAGVAAARVGAVTKGAVSRK
jgi:hypothetical protein